MSSSVRLKVSTSIQNLFTNSSQELGSRKSEQLKPYSTDTILIKEYIESNRLKCALPFDTGQ